MGVLRWAVAGGLLTAALISAAFMRDMGRAYDRIRDKGTVISSAYGDIQFTEGGSGPAVLVIHGSGGGYDQGELIAQAVLGADFHWITPSRFGYLGSSFHEGASWDDQAHAYAALLDYLAIGQVAVVAMSQGGPSALLFAVLHPDRVASLTLISCGVVTSTEAEQSQANKRGDMLATIFSHDWLYWVISKLFKKQLMRIAAIKAPTLTLHAKDDGLQLFHNAEFAAATIPAAELISFETGGHFIIGTQQAAIRSAVRTHIRKHAKGTGDDPG